MNVVSCSTLMLAMLGQVTASAATSWSPGTARLFATVDHSEWCPAGNVQLDLSAGRYALTRRAARPGCSDPTLNRPSVNDSLDRAGLAALRLAWERAQREGLENAACRAGGKPDDPIVSNGGTPVLILTSGAATIATPSDHSCWSDAALALHDTLERAVSPGDYRKSPAR